MTLKGFKVRFLIYIKYFKVVKFNYYSNKVYK